MSKIIEQLNEKIGNLLDSDDSYDSKAGQLKILKEWKAREEQIEKVIDELIVQLYPRDGAITYEEGIEIGRNQALIELRQKLEVRK